MIVRRSGHVAKRDGPDPIDAEIGKRLRDFRAQRKLTLDMLGAKVGLTYQQIQKYETGANRIPASKLHHIALALDLPVGALFNVEADPMLVFHAEAISRVPEPVRTHLCAVIVAVRSWEEAKNRR